MTILEILDEYNIPYRMAGEHHHATPSFVQVDCPYCSPNTQRWRMGIALEGFACPCYNCGTHPFYETLQELTGLPAKEVYKLKGGIDFSAARHKPKAVGKLQLPKGLGPLQECHKRYLRKRGFDPDKLAKLWGIQGIGLAAKYAWRLFIPVFYRGVMVSWTTRSISDDCETRYVNAPPECETVSIKSTVYGLDYARHAIVICEGPTDAIRIGPGAVATFGVNVTSEQLTKLIPYPQRTILFDNEKEAQRRARNLADELGVYPGKTINLVGEYEGKDPGSYSEKSIRHLRKSYLDD